MSRLVLRFENAMLKEVPLGTQPVTIGRAPDNDIQPSNLAVSNYHAASVRRSRVPRRSRIPNRPQRIVFERYSRRTRHAQGRRHHP